MPLSFSQELLFPPKQDCSEFFAEIQMKKEESMIQNEESHSEKFNGPLEKPKTANKAFGSIADFLLFFENRNAEIKAFAKRFQEMEQVDKKFSYGSFTILNADIAPALYRSFTNIQVEFKNHDSSKLTDKTEEDEQSKQNLKKALSKFLQKKKIQKEEKARKDYARLFEKQFQNLDEFYKQILHAYTIPGFLYRRMNEYLRTENWIKLDDLLIYTYCLFKAFQWGPTGLTDADSFAYLKLKAENNKLTLYRRADFDQLSIDFYQLGRIREFSWAGVTSTSLVESATRQFAGKQPGKKPVLIIIEVNFQNLQPENFNALYLAKISRCPLEEEVALAPGSIFELLDIDKTTPEVVMRLGLVTNAKILAQQGKFLHGMLQSVMRNEKVLKIVCLTGKDLSRAIKHCKGNLLIEDLEFSLCEFDHKAAEILLDALPTMKNLASFTLSTVVLGERCNLDNIFESLGRLKIKTLEVLSSFHQDDQVKSLLNSLQHLGSLRRLKLTLAQTLKIDVELTKSLENGSAQHLHPECLFELKIQDGLSIFTKQLGRNNFHEYFRSMLKKEVFRKIFEEESRVLNQMNLDQGFIQGPEKDAMSFSIAKEEIGKLFKKGILTYIYKS